MECSVTLLSIQLVSVNRWSRTKVSDAPNQPVWCQILVTISHDTFKCHLLNQTIRMLQQLKQKAMIG